MPSLRMVHGAGTGRTFPQERDLTVLGRDGGCDIPLDDHEVSKRHARIVRRDDGFYLEDIGSTNGTRVGDRELTEPRRLADGDLIEIGESRLVFTEGDAVIVSALDTSSKTDPRIVGVRPEERLRAVLEIAGNLGGTIDLDGVLGSVLESLLGIFPQAERGFILLRGEGAEELVVKASKDRRSGATPPILSRTIFHHVVGQGQAVLCEDATADPHFGQAASVKEAGIRTLICVPLRDRGGKPVGVLQIDTRGEHGRFEADDLGLLAAVAGPVGVAIENARLHEIAVKQAALEREARDARAVQLALIPRRKPDLPGYDFWHAYEPARHVGGDYFDYRPVPVGEAAHGRASRWTVAVGDVMGKGMPAALMMARLSSEVGLLLQVEPDPARVVERLNKSLCEAEIGEFFITFQLVVLDGERHELTIVNAGHMPPLVRRPDGSVEEMAPGRSGNPLGIEAGATYEVGRGTLMPGEVVVLYSDGVTDALDAHGHQFGDGRLKQALAAAPAGVGSAGESILDAVRRHAAGRGQFDDMTLICFGRG